MGSFDSVNKSALDFVDAGKLLDIMPGPLISRAEDVFDVLVEQIDSFQNSLESDQEVVMLFASFGQSVTMNVEKISYRNPQLIFFYGSVNGRPTRLIQHINQLSFLMQTIKIEALKPARRIGFGND